MVAPYSGAMLASVARSASFIVETPGPKYSTNLPTTPSLRRISVAVSTRSVAVAPGGSWPKSSKPITSGKSMYRGWPSITASASMPPTPQPNTPSPLIIVVWLSVPTSVSGRATGPNSSSRRNTHLARNSRFTWWTIPTAGGTTRKLSNALCPQRRNS